VLLVEARDFAAGTSSRSTKLIHGGVRYLAQGRIGLVREALRERGHLLRNAPALVHPLRFVVPARMLAERLLLRVGLGAYDRARGGGRAGRLQCDARRGRPCARRCRGCATRAARRRGLPRCAVRRRRPGARARPHGERFGALVLNHCALHALVVEDGAAARRRVPRHEGGRMDRVAARAVINATGVWGDALRRRPTRPPRRCCARARACIWWSTATACPVATRCWCRACRTGACCS
jgi:glycerol-3-phosphate dehydrogenase